MKKGSKAASGIRTRRTANRGGSFKGKRDLVISPRRGQLSGDRATSGSSAGGSFKRKINSGNTSITPSHASAAAPPRKRAGSAVKRKVGNGGAATRWVVTKNEERAMRGADAARAPFLYPVLLLHVLGEGRRSRLAVLLCILGFRCCCSTVVVAFLFSAWIQFSSILFPGLIQ